MLATKQSCGWTSGVVLSVSCGIRMPKCTLSIRETRHCLLLTRLNRYPYCIFGNQHCFVMVWGVRLPKDSSVHGLVLVANVISAWLAVLL